MFQSQGFLQDSLQKLQQFFARPSDGALPNCFRVLRCRSKLHSWAKFEPSFESPWPKRAEELVQAHVSQAWSCVDLLRMAVLTSWSCLQIGVIMLITPTVSCPRTVRTESQESQDSKADLDQFTISCSFESTHVPISLFDLGIFSPHSPVNISDSHQS